MAGENTEGSDPMDDGDVDFMAPAVSEFLLAADSDDWADQGVREMMRILRQQWDAMRTSRERALHAARNLRRFMDAYFTEDNITEQAADVLGETAWIEGPR